ncbi:hypothetical protein V8E36_007119 [Tilletia maclaganii]
MSSSMDANGPAVAGNGTGSTTVIQSPFFRPEILAAYARDVLQAADYPTLHASMLFQPLALPSSSTGQRSDKGSTEDSSNDDVLAQWEAEETRLPPLTAANTKALQEASQAISAHLVLFDQPQDPSEGERRGRSEDKLTAARLRSHLAATLILLNQHTKALAHLNLASDALRPPKPRRKAKQDESVAEPLSSAPSPSSTSVEVDSVRITLWILTERACLALGKTEDFRRIHRWRLNLQSQLASQVGEPS